MISSPHLTQDILQRFLRTELTRRENQLVVRHLLTRCSLCLQVVQEADRTAGPKLTEARRPPALRLAERMG